tara:strand:+ start:411 stop:647 length:237 start_codon:yes stop_codon:yes gene_type:complete
VLTIHFEALKPTGLCPICLKIHLKYSKKGAAIIALLSRYIQLLTSRKSILDKQEGFLTGCIAFVMYLNFQQILLKKKR